MIRSIKQAILIFNLLLSSLAYTGELEPKPTSSSTAGLTPLKIPLISASTGEPKYPTQVHTASADSLAGSKIAKICCIRKPNQVTRFSCKPTKMTYYVDGVPCGKWICPECCLIPKTWERHPITPEFTQAYPDLFRYTDS